MNLCKLIVVFGKESSNVVSTSLTFSFFLRTMTFSSNTILCRTSIEYVKHKIEPLSCPGKFSPSFHSFNLPLNSQLPFSTGWSESKGKWGKRRERPALVPACFWIQQWRQGLQIGSAPRPVLWEMCNTLFVTISKTLASFLLVFIIIEVR